MEAIQDRKADICKYILSENSSNVNTRQNSKSRAVNTHTDNTLLYDIQPRRDKSITLTCFNSKILYSSSWKTTK